MGSMQRRKGADGEREFLRWLRRELNMPTLVRHLGQARRKHAADLEQTLAGFVLEIKRQALWRECFWDQAQQQADARGGIPALAYRGNVGQWVVMIPAHVIGAETASGRLLLCKQDWAALVKARLKLYGRV